METEMRVASRGSASSTRWKLFGILLLLACTIAVATLAAAPYLKIPLTPFTAIGSVLFAVAVTALGAWIGLWPGRQIGWDAPELRAWVANEPGAFRAINKVLPLAVGGGLATGLIQVAIADGILHALNLQLTTIPLWLGVIGALSGGIREEVMYRLGLMTLIAWIGTKWRRQEQPGPALVWTANGLSALVFGAQHFSSDFALVQGHTSAALLGVIILLYHTGAGLVFGWFYWRRGLVAAMAAHFTSDIAISLVNALVGLF